MKPALAVAATASVLVLGAYSVNETGALWRQAVEPTDAVITSGTLDITVGAGGTSVNNYSFTGLTKTNANQGEFVQRPLVVKNSGNIEMRYRLQTVSQSSGTLPLTLTATLVANEASCPTTGTPSGTSLYSGAMIGAQAPTAPAWRVVGAGASEVWCLRATIGAAAPQSASTTVTFTFRAES